MGGSLFQVMEENAPSKWFACGKPDRHGDKEGGATLLHKINQHFGSKKRGFFWIVEKERLPQTIEDKAPPEYLVWKPDRSIGR